MVTIQYLYQHSFDLSDLMKALPNYYMCLQMVTISISALLWSIWSYEGTSQWLSASALCFGHLMTSHTLYWAHEWHPTEPEVTFCIAYYMSVTLTQLFRPSTSFHFHNLKGTSRLALSLKTMPSEGLFCCPHYNYANCHEQLTVYCTCQHTKFTYKDIWWILVADHQANATHLSWETPLDKGYLLNIKRT